MKTYTSPALRILLLVTLLTGSNACREQLDTAPLSSYANETFWTSENNALLALTGVYRGNIQMAAVPSTNSEYSATDWWSYHGLLFLDFATDNAYDRRGDNSGFNQLTNGNLTASNSYVSNYWNSSYARIARCNYFLENVGKAPVSADKIARFSAETRFIRACQYFYMSQTYGSVPLITKTLSPDEANAVAKATKADVLKYAMDEFTAVAPVLPRAKDLPSTERGRATRQAALAFLGRAQLASNDFAGAATTYKTIIDFGDNGIDPDFQSLFNGTNEASREILFATQYVKDLGPNAMQQHCFPRANGGFSIYCPLGSLVESFEFADGTPFSYADARYNAKNPSLGRDPRLRYSVLFNGDRFQNVPYITHPDSVNGADQTTTSKQATRTGYNLNKFCWEGQTGDLQNSGIDLPVIRYAEVLLSYLEAKLESGAAIDQGVLDQSINAVRGRATVQMPKITEKDPAKLRVLLRRERRNELAFEGIRLWDLMRWKVAADVLKGDFYGAPFPGAKNLRKKNATTTDPVGRWYVTSKAFRAGVDDTWPIPLGEVSINPNLK